MALCASGAMSLGGTTVGRSVNCELGCSGTAAICMNRTDVRTLAGKASGAIAMSDFYGKSSGPPPATTLGQVYEGGYYTGVINAGVGSYYIVVSPNATGCNGTCFWKTAATSTAGACSLVNGHLNTYTALANATHPAGNWAATRSINGFSDWYLPSKDELNTMYVNRGSMPAGEGYNTGTGQSNYYSSTEFNAGCACSHCFNTGAITFHRKGGNIVTRNRIVRRSPV